MKVSNKIQIQLKEMDSILNKLNKKGEEYLDRIVESMKKNDTRTMSMLSNELSKIHKVTDMLTDSRISLGKVFQTMEKGGI